MRDRSFAPTVALGLAGGALGAVAAAKDWARATGDAAGLTVHAAVRGSEVAPVGVALARVALAGWGAVLVLRGRARRGIAVVGALASAGAVAACLGALGNLRHAALAALATRGATGATAPATLTPWYVTALAALLVCLAAFVVAVRRAPAWPAMGSRYDAPGTRAAEPVTERDLWRALDEGHDPTA